MGELKLKIPAGAESPVDPQPCEISCSQGGWAMSYFLAFVSQLNIAVVTKGKFFIWLFQIVNQFLAKWSTNVYLILVLLKF